jgi:hypothetical protein
MDGGAVMRDATLEAVAAGVRQLEGLLDGFAQQGDVEKLRKAGHGLAATAVKALQDADTARKEAEDAFSLGVDRGGEIVRRQLMTEGARLNEEEGIQ